MAAYQSDPVAGSPEAHLAVLERLFEAFNTQDRERFDTCYADSIDVHNPAGTRTMDHDEHWAEVQGIFEVMPDLRATLDNAVAQGDHVFYRCTYAGTHERDIKGVEPTGERLAWDHWSDYRFEDGVIREAWQLSDRHGLYEQLGLVGEDD